ncbi:MAG: hypothetical protein ACI9Y1_001375, partial [Lentisphaeria bacterium]
MSQLYLLALRLGVHFNVLNKAANKPEKCLYVYDKAVTDYAWWNHQRRHENYMISVLKENS